MERSLVVLKRDGRPQFSFALIGKPKFCRHNADYRVVLTVELQRLSNDVYAGPEASFPEALTNNDNLVPSRLSSSSRKSRPTSGRTPIKLSRPTETRPANRRSGFPSPVRL